MSCALDLDVDALRDITHEANTSISHSGYLAAIQTRIPAPVGLPKWPSSKLYPQFDTTNDKYPVQPLDLDSNDVEHRMTSPQSPRYMVVTAPHRLQSLQAERKTATSFGPKRAESAYVLRPSVRQQSLTRDQRSQAITAWTNKPEPITSCRYAMSNVIICMLIIVLTVLLITLAFYVDT
jgi:hypothetical protein